jgi:hypothetical protein
VSSFSSVVKKHRCYGNRCLTKLKDLLRISPCYGKALIAFHCNATGFRVTTSSSPE